MTKWPAATPAHYCHSFKMKRKSALRPFKALDQHAANGSFADQTEILKTSDLRLQSGHSLGEELATECDRNSPLQTNWCDLNPYPTYSHNVSYDTAQA
ncbi:hypothetical protein [Roseibium sp. Sym1]|uniref:hypothetical protein n=1 Tax=Roseibium sp. Sym1 TaxID=3016006 RepID=UPI0022B489DD|nr:hypothetical protein [Roseibium sp. Sym1]